MSDIRDDEQKTARWRSDVAQWMTRAVGSIDDTVDAKWRALQRRLGRSGRARILPYLGYSTDRAVRVGGRVLTNPVRDDPDPGDDWWENLLDTYRHFHSREVPGVTVALELAGTTHHATSDAEGYVWFDVPGGGGLEEWEGWHGTVLRITEAPVDADQAPVPVAILAPTGKARFGIISDMDDTVIHTNATNLLTAARLTFLQNARTRKPLDGVAALYRAMRRGVTDGHGMEGNPIFYVSSSAWNLYPLLTDFLELNDIPAGPLFLRDLGFDEDKFLKGGHYHKLEKALRIMNGYPDLPFVLIGDSGQEDAHLYAQAVERDPTRILAVYIRDVDPGEPSEKDHQTDQHLETIRNHGVPAIRVVDSHEIATHAVSLRLLEPTALRGIRSDTNADRERPDPGGGLG